MKKKIFKNKNKNKKITLPVAVYAYLCMPYRCYLVRAVLTGKAYNKIEERKKMLETEIPN